MELGNQIKKYRQEAQLSQEELANRVYVSRQTISNWENDKSYPDVNSLVLLGEIFQVSLDKLIKGDVEIMKEVIKKEDVAKLKLYSTIYAGLLILTLVSLLGFIAWLGMWGLIPCGIIYTITFGVALKVEKIKKDNDIQTYKEIIAFEQGERLDEIQKQREIGKRPYQKVLQLLGGALVGAIIGAVMLWIDKG